MGGGGERAPLLRRPALALRLAALVLLRRRAGRCLPDRWPRPVRFARLRVRLDHDGLGVGRAGERRELPRVERGQEPVQPGDEVVGLEDLAHEGRLLQTRGEEVGAPRLVGRRAPEIVSEQALGSRDDRLLQRPVPNAAGGLQHHREREGGVAVRPDAGGTLEILEMIHHPFREEPGQGLHPIGPLVGRGVLPRAQLLVQLQQPGPSVRALEAPAFPEELELALERLLGEMVVELLLDERRDAEIRELLVDAHERPGRVHGRVPVPAAVEGPGLLEAGNAPGDERVQVGASVGRHRVRTIETGEGHRRERQRHLPIELRDHGVGNRRGEPGQDVAAGGRGRLRLLRGGLGLGRAGGRQDGRRHQNGRAHRRNGLSRQWSSQHGRQCAGSRRTARLALEEAVAPGDISVPLRVAPRA